METQSPVSVLILTQLIIILLISAHSQGSKTCKLFNLGDSNSDTGAKCAGFGAPAITVVLPGHENLCRASDGRLYIDFLCESLGMDPLTPYLESVGSDFSNGVNLAYVGAHIIGNGTVPLFIQAQQFARFEKRTRELLRKGQGPRITKSGFQNGIFSLDIGQNDLDIALGKSSYQQAVDYIPSLLNNIEQATKMLYGLIARKFMIYNTGPLGCLPHYLSAGKSRGMQLDELGCLATYNQVATAYNEGLNSLCIKLRNELQEATIVYIDMYTIKYDLVANSTKYGFENPFVPCLDGNTLCLNPSRSVFWDELHYTEAANKIVASKIWSGDYAWPYIKFKDLCEMEIKGGCQVHDFCVGLQSSWPVLLRWC